MNRNSQTRDRARKLLENGQTAEALTLLAENIKDSPRDIDSIYLSGICHARSGNHVLAEKFFQKAVKLNKGLFGAYFNLGLSQSFQRKTNEAIKSFRKSLAINPSSAVAHSRIALAYLQTGEAAKALQHAKKSVEIDSSNPTYMNVKALSYRESGRIEKAIDTWHLINTAHPNFYSAYYSLYETYRLIDDIASAEDTLLRARELFANQVNVYLALGKFYEQTNRTLEARDLYAEGIDNCADNADLLIALGRANRILGLFGEGLERIDQALRMNRAYQPALTERCSFHILSGEYDEAHALMENFISSNPEETLTPGFAMAYAHTCRLTGRYDESISALRSTLQRSDIDVEMKAVIHFSMGDSYDKMQKYDRAFAMYRKANSVVAHKSDIDHHLDILADISSAVSRDALEKAVKSEVATSKPVFIVGMPRSGTSLAEQIIASHPQAFGAGEITELWQIAQDISENKGLKNYTEKLASLDKQGINRYARRYLAFIESLNPDAMRITDKLPHNFMHIALITQLFPDAQIIHCHRHPFDTCLSIYFKKFNDDHIYARNLSEIARYYKKYSELMNLWAATSTSIFSLKYEDLVSNTEKVTRDVISYLGLAWDEKCLRHHESDRLISTPSYTQANAPVYADSIYRWKNYDGHLRPLIDILGSPEQYE